MTIRPLLLLAIGTALVGAGPLTASIVRNVEKTFAVQPGGTFKASTQGGDIVVKTDDIAEVRVVARQKIRAATEAEADRLLEKLALTMEQTGNDVTVEAKYEKPALGFRFGSWPPVQVDVLVTLPRRFSVDLQSSKSAVEGAVDAGLLKARINLDLNTSGGDIKVDDLSGTVRAGTSGGDVVIARIDGEVDARTSGGDITLRQVSARAKVHTSGGDIRVENTSGPIDAETSGGDIVIKEAARLARAHTSGGDVHAVLTAPLQADCELSTSGGDVSVRLTPDASFNLDASTSGGEVDASGLTITIEKGGLRKSALKGRVNGGGPTLKLRTSGGDIAIHTS